MRIIRDFLYVDRDKLYSIYSQVFEGVVDQIVSSYVAEAHTSTAQNSALRQAKIEEQVAEATTRTENRSLYDFMYNSLENKLASSLSDLSSVDATNYHDQVSHSALVKARGRAEIEDFDRFDAIADKFNDLGTLVAYGILQKDQKVQDTLAAIDQDIKNTKDRNKRARLEAQVRSTTDLKRKAREIARAKNLSYDEEQLALLRMVATLFNAGGYEVTILPPSGKGEVVFRGILDKRHLRASPDMIRALYGGATTSEWTMVGQVTHIPGSPGAVPSTKLLTSSSSEEPSMRDPFRKLLGAMRAFEEMFMKSKERHEVLVSPIAIYRDIKINDT